MAFDLGTDKVGDSRIAEHGLGRTDAPVNSRGHETSLAIQAWQNTT
jgi:hypothetical protein